MSWLITRDLLTPDASDEFHRVGVGFGIEALKAVPKAERITFHLLDDDREHYYTGEADVAAYDDDETRGGLYTAYQWAMGDAGVTHCVVTLDTAVSKLGMTPEIAERIAFPSGPHKGWVTLFG